MGVDPSLQLIVVQLDTELHQLSLDIESYPNVVVAYFRNDQFFDLPGDIVDVSGKVSVLVHIPSSSTAMNLRPLLQFLDSKYMITLPNGLCSTGSGMPCTFNH